MKIWRKLQAGLIRLSTFQDSGKTVGTEVKEGGAQKSKNQREIDAAVKAGAKVKPGPKATRAGVKQIEEVRDMRMPRKEPDAIDYH